MEWSSLLTMRSPHWLALSEYHAQEMHGTQLRDEQSELFYRVIEKHLSVHISVSLRPSEVKRVYENAVWPDWLDNREVIGNAYFAGFQAMMLGLTWEQNQFGIDGPVELIFDAHSSWKQPTRSWNITKQWTPFAQVRALMRQPPSFRNSATTMPLQAADLLAYYVRQSDVASSGKLVFPWKQNKRMRGVHFFLTEEMLRKKLNDVVLACSLGRANISPATVAYIVNKRRTLPPKR
jgi:hypothetical protein